MMAMAKAALALSPQRTIWFVHGCRNSAHHAFAEEIGALARVHSTLNLHVVYSRPLPSDQGRYQSQGYVDGALLQRLVQGPASYYLCGSSGFMDSLVAALQQGGVEPSAIRFERFSKAPPVASATPDAPAEAAGTTTVSSSVTFCRSGITAVWDGSQPDQSLLELAEASGLQPPFACRAGVCGTCTTRLRSGAIRYLAEPSAAVPPGSALLCIACPASESLVLEQ